MQISSEKISDRYLEVNSCAVQELRTRDREMLRRDGRVDYHVLYIMEGCCYVTEGERVMPVTAGHLILYRPQERQEYAFRAADSTVSGYIHFSGKGCEEFLRACGLLRERMTYIGISRETVRAFEELADEFILKKPLCTEICAALLQRFLAMAGRAAYDAEHQTASALRHSMDVICKAMHRDYEQSYDVAHYAALCHLSPGRFAHVFKECTGISPKHYMLQVKVDMACQLLSATDLSVAEVAMAVGITDVNYFSRLVKKYTGRSPRKQR